MRLLEKRFVLTFLCLCYFSANSFDLSRINLSYLYDLSNGFQFKHRVVSTGEEVEVYYQIATDSIQRWEQTFLIQEGYSSAGHDTLKLFSLDTLASSVSSITLRLRIIEPQKGLLIISWSNPASNTYLVHDVSIRSPEGFPSFIPMNEDGLPQLDSYITEDKLKINGSSDRYHVFQYREDFGPADPAMGVMKPIAPNLTVDSAYYFDGTLEELSIYHFFLIQEDTLEENGITLLKCPVYYPELKRIEELVEPLTYITTPNELKTLKGQMSKKAFENFWINTYGTKFRAKNAIRVFYDRVEQANQLFTDYKQGWKTDRGMLYIVFGKPDQVLRTGRSEMWRYKDGTEFEFIRISTLFTPSMYALKRDRKYEEIWFNQVGEIRKGI